MTKTEDTPDAYMRVLKTATCKSITGKSSLTYQIGALPDSTVHIRISKNTGAGFFNNEWIKIDDIQKALADGPKEQPLTSFLLQPVLRGKSVNTAAFLMAALTQEKLLRVLKGKKRGHELLDPEAFNAKMDRLVSAKANIGVKTKATVKKAARKPTETVTKKAAIKKKSMSRRKTSKTG